MANPNIVSEASAFVLNDVLRLLENSDFRILVNDQLKDAELSALGTFSENIVTSETPGPVELVNAKSVLNLYRSSFEMPYGNDEFDLAYMSFIKPFPYFTLLHYFHQINRVLKNGASFFFSIREQEGFINELNNKLENNISISRINEIDIKRLLLPYFSIKSMQRIRKVSDGTEYFSWEVSAVKNVLL